MAGYRGSPMMFTPVSNVTATLGANSPALGEEVFYNGNSYRYVYNAGGEQVSPGMGVTVSLSSGYSVTVSSTTAVGDLCLGVVKHATLTTATYGWVLTKGFVPVEAVANSAIGNGDDLTLGGSGLFAAAPATAVAGTPIIVGKAVAATASAGSAMAYISCF